MTETTKRPLVGVATLLFKACGGRLGDRLVLLGKRKGSHGAGTWSAPGGHLEFCEDPACAAIREVKEETGIVLTQVVRSLYIPYASTYFRETDQHYITLFFTALLSDGQEPKLLEPDRCEEWRWFPIYEPLPQPLFGALAGFDGPPLAPLPEEPPQPSPPMSPPLSPLPYGTFAYAVGETK